MSETIQIWCDGSYRQEHGTIGVGWVRAAGGETTELSRSLPRPHDSRNHGSDIAEFGAFAAALAPVPAGSRVHVHMDCQNVVAALTNEKLSAKHLAMPALRAAFYRAVEAKLRMGKVEISFTSDSNPRMARAHQLSRMATTPPRDAPRKHSRPQGRPSRRF